MSSLLRLVKNIYHHLEGIKHRGDNFTCPCCGRKYRNFRPLPYGEGSCWVCFSYPRTRSFKLFLDNYLKDKVNVRFLHIAPEAVLNKWLCSDSRVDYTPCDKRMPGYEYPSNVKYADITALPFDDNSFDFLLCSHVLEHVKNDRVGISELFRVLRPGGEGIVQVPIDYDRTTTDEELESENLSPQEREARFGQYDHVKIYGRDFLDRLKDVGFIPRELTLSQEEKRKYGLNNHEPIIWVNKPGK